MIEKSKVSAKQIVLLTFISRIVITLTYWPALTSPPANQDLWIASLISLPIQLLLTIPVYLLYKRFPNQSIIQYSQTIFGKAGKLIGLLFVLFFIHIAITTLGQFNVFITTAIMPETPILFFAISLVILCAYAVVKGIQALGRVSEIISVLIMVSIISLAILLLKDMDLKELTPILEKGWGPVLSGAFTISIRSVEVLGLAMILPNLNNTQKTKSAIVNGPLVTLLFWTIMTITLLCVLGVEEAKSRTFPFFSAVRVASLGGFLERIDAVHMGVWILGVFVKVSFFYYLAVIGLSQVFNLKDYKSLVIPVGAVIVPLTILMESNIVELREFTSYKIFTWYSLFFIFIIPLIIWAVALIRKKGAIQK